MYLPSVSCEYPYIEIDKANHYLTELEDLHDKLLSQAVLFEIPQPESNILQLTKKSLRLNKQLWDFVHMVKSWINVWQTTLWKYIDSEFMDMEVKRFAKDLKGIFLCLIMVIIVINKLYKSYKSYLLYYF